MIVENNQERQVGGMLLFGYLLLFAVQIGLLVFALKRLTTSHWCLLYVIEMLSVVAALILMVYFDNLPGYGMMPGLTYFAEVFYSFFASIGFGILLLISVFVGLVAKRNKR